MTETETTINNIAPALAELAGPIAELNLHPQNYRQGDVEVIRASLRRFGQVKPIVVQASTMNVVAGNHTMKSAVEEGWDRIARVIVDMPDEEAEAFLVADNRASDKATNDNAVLSAILERLMLAGRLEGTGYSPDDVDDMLAAMDALPETEPEPTEAAPSVDDEKLAERFANRSQVALRQFVLMYPQDGTSDEVEAMANRLKRAWGVSSMADVVREALTRATAEPPVEGLTEEERARADAPVPAPEGTGDHVLYSDKPESNERLYHHPNCAKWVVPLDGMTEPEDTVECAECATVLPVHRLRTNAPTMVEEPVATSNAEAAPVGSSDLPNSGPDPANPPAVEPADTTAGAVGGAGTAEQAPEPGSAAAFEQELP